MSLSSAAYYEFVDQRPTPKPFEGIRAASGDPFGHPRSSAPRYETKKPQLDDVYRNNARPFRLIDNSPGNVTFSEDLAERMAKSLYMNPSALIRAFFSRENLEVVQKSLAHEVYRLTGFRIERQADETILTVMRAIFADHGINQPRDVANEVLRLNRGTVAAITDNVISNITAHLSYLRDASRLRTPMERGAATSTKGVKTTLPLFRPI
jgi:hypothetical protein